MYHRFSQIFGAGLTSAMEDNDLVGGTVVCNRVGIVDRDIVGTLIELGHRIAARLHHIGDEFVSFVHCAFGIVDELL